jgi:hypothetical protein
VSLASGALAGVAALAIAGCGAAAHSAGSSGGSGKRTKPAVTPAAAIARAADISGSTSGFALRFSTVESIPGAGTERVSGSGAFSTPNHGGTLNLVVHAAGQSYSMQEIVRGKTFYFKLPSALSARIPGSKPWWKFDLSQLAGHSPLSSFSSITNSSFSNPADTLDYLKGEASSVQDLGPTTVDGVATTEYRLKLDLHKAGVGEPTATRAALQRVLDSAAGKLVNATSIPATVWVDGAQRVRKLTVSVAIRPPGSGQAITTTTTLDITDYGPQPAPAAPPAGQTVNLLSLLQSASSTASGAVTGATPGG